VQKVYNININIKSIKFHKNTGVTIIPGNRYFGSEGKSYYFNRNMPLEELVSEAKNWQGLPKEKGLPSTHHHLIFVQFSPILKP